MLQVKISLWLVMLRTNYKLISVHELAMYFSKKTYLCTNKITNKILRRQANNYGSFYFICTHVMSLIYTGVVKSSKSLSVYMLFSEDILQLQGESDQS